MPIINLRHIPAFMGWTAYTPVIPKLYWDVYSQEERIKRLCMEYDKLMHYASHIAKELNDLSQEINDILQELQEKIDNQLEEQNKKIEETLADFSQRIEDAIADLNEQMAEQNRRIEEMLAAQDDKIEAQIAEQNRHIEEQLAEQNRKFEEAVAGITEYIDDKIMEYQEGTLTYDVTTGTYRPSKQAMRRLYQALAYGFKEEYPLVSHLSENVTVQQMSEQTVYNAAWGNPETITINDQLLDLSV